MSAVMESPVPVVNKCRIEEVFDLSFIELIKLVPRNSHVRALILKFTGKMPGQDCATFEQIEEWVKTNCKPRVFNRTQPASHTGISIQVAFSETEYGSANYSVPTRGREEFNLEADDLLEIAQSTVDDGELLDELLDRLTEKVKEDAWEQCQPNMESVDDYEYNNHDSSGSEDGLVTVSREEMRQAVTRFLNERRPELLHELE